MTSNHRARMAVAMFVSLVLTACGDNRSSVSVGSDGQSKINMSAPSFLTTRAINQADLRLTVILNDTELPMVRNADDTWTGSGQVPQNDNATLMVEWNEAMPNDTRLLLARYNETQQNVNAQIVFDVPTNQYITTGVDFDEDSDNYSNLTERRQDSDPFDALDPGVDSIAPDVKVSAIRRLATIDGSFDGDVWSNGQFQDINDINLSIDNVIVDEDGGNVSDSVSYSWAAMHDERYLSLFVFGRVTNASNPPSVDSGEEYWNDDSLEIFIDGNLSQNIDDYDRIDDMHIMIPLAINDQGGFADNNSDLPIAVRRIRRGTSVKTDVVFDVKDEEIVEFATCICFGQQSTWEVRIDMVAAQIPVGKTFGFEMQINVDDDGGTRNTKWAWAARGRVPGDTNENTDVAWLYPSGFGLVQLLPFGG